MSLGPPERYVLVAAPGFLVGRKLPRNPKELLGQPCIVTRFKSGVQPPWDFRKGKRPVRIMPTGPLTAAHPELQLQAAIDGLGFLMTMEGYARASVASGRLVTLLDDWTATFPGPFLYYPGRRQQPPSLTAFVSFVKEWRAVEPGQTRPCAKTRIDG